MKIGNRFSEALNNAPLGAIPDFYREVVVCDYLVFLKLRRSDIIL